MLSGPPVFGGLRDFVPSVSGTDALWTLLGIQRPTAQDARGVLDGLSHKKALKPEKKLIMLEALRFLVGAPESLTLKAGYRLERRTCPAGVNGCNSPEEKVVVVDKELEPAQAAKTLVHELGHIRANHYGRFPDYAIDRVCRGAAEVEAESIAYIVTSHLGMNPAAYSVPYVAGWADDLDVLRHHMKHRRHRLAVDPRRP